MPLINSKIHLELSWNKYCVRYGPDTYNDGHNTNNRETTFQITSTKLYVPIVILSTKDNVDLNWNEYKSKIETKNSSNNFTRFPLHASFQGVNRLFVLAFDNTNNDARRVKRDSHRKYFFPRVGITGYNVLIGGRTETFMINQLVINSKSIMKLEKLQQEKEIITQQDVC